MEKNYMEKAIRELQKKALKLSESSIFMVKLSDAEEALQNLEVAILNYVEIKKIKEEKNNLY